MDDALARAAAYTAAGADGLMIHSKQTSPDEVLTFAGAFRSAFPDVPLLCVPTTYHRARDEELADAGFDVIIYANHLLRAAFPAMQRAAASILEYGRSFEVEESLLPLEQTLRLGAGRGR